MTTTTTPIAELADARYELETAEIAYRVHKRTCAACWPVICPEAWELYRRADRACERVLSLESVG